METQVLDFHPCFYTHSIQKLALHLPHVHMIVNHHCGKTRQETLNICAAYQDVLRH